MGRVAYAMLHKLALSPSGESGFRAAEISKTAIVHGWVRQVWQSGRITFFAITEEGREALKQQRKP